MQSTTEITDSKAYTAQDPDLLFLSSIREGLSFVQFGKEPYRGGKWYSKALAHFVRQCPRGPATGELCGPCRHVFYNSSPSFLYYPNSPLPSSIALSLRCARKSLNIFSADISNKFGDQGLVIADVLCEHTNCEVSIKPRVIWEDDWSKILQTKNLQSYMNGR